MSPRIKPVAILPTLCTLGNTFCGFLAISKVADALLRPSAFEHNILFAAWMILIAMIFDALDGRIARMTNQASDFGAQLDSLTDLITFGVAPAFLVKVIFDHTLTAAEVPYAPKFPLILSVVYTICAALRLARFTLETDDAPAAHEKFYGLPSPAAAGVAAASVFLVFEAGSPLYDVSPAVHLALVKAQLWILPALGLLMVSRVEYVHVMSRLFRGRKPFLHLVAILAVLFLAATWHETVFFLVFGGYAVAGPLLALREQRSRRKSLAGPGDTRAAASALVALGSNLGDREAHLAFAVEQLEQLPDTRVAAVSDWIETAPVGGPPQRPFLNGAALLETRLEPEELLRRLLAIEVQRGRVRTVQDGPRVLDLDLVLYGGVICENPVLTLPHPRFRERTFVLEPAAEVAPDLVDPITRRSISDLLREARARDAR